MFFKILYHLEIRPIHNDGLHSYSPSFRPTCSSRTLLTPPIRLPPQQRWRSPPPLPRRRRRSPPAPTAATAARSSSPSSSSLRPSPDQLILRLTRAGGREECSWCSSRRPRTSCRSPGAPPTQIHSASGTIVLLSCLNNLALWMRHIMFYHISSQYCIVLLVQLLYVAGVL